MRQLQRDQRGSYVLVHCSGIRKNAFKKKGGTFLLQLILKQPKRSISGLVYLLWNEIPRPSRRARDSLGWM